MQPSEHNLLILTLISFAVALLAAGSFVIARPRSGIPRFALASFAILLAFLALLAMTRTLWWLLSKGSTENAWPRSPSFYVTLCLLLAAVALLFRSQHPRSAASRSLILAVLLILAVGTVGASEKLIKRAYHDRSVAHAASLQSAIGQLAPDFTFCDLEGHPHTLSDYRGKVVLLNIWMTSCPPCIHEMPDLSALQDRAASRGLVLVLLSPENAAAVSKFFSTHPTQGLKATLSAASPAPDFYHAYEAWPTTFLIDRTGHVVDNWLGAPPPAELNNRVEAHL